MIDEEEDVPQRSGDDEGDANAWMATFSDLLMLMLTFFVLLLTMSSMDAQKIKKIVRPGIHVDSSFSSQEVAINYAVQAPKIVPKQVLDITKRMTIEDDEEMFKSVQQNTEEVIARYSLEDQGWITRREDNVEVNVHGQIAFLEGSNKLTPRARAMLQELSLMGKVAGLNLHIEAYVDRGREFIAEETAWDLALRRADAVARFVFRQKYDPTRLRIAGYGYAAGRDEQRFLRQTELLTLKFSLPKSKAPEPSAYEPSGLENAP